MYPYIYSLCEFNVWNARLCHVNKHIIYNLINLGLIQKMNVSDFEKYEYCNQAKITKTSHKLVVK